MMCVNKDLEPNFRWWKYALLSFLVHLMEVRKFTSWSYANRVQIMRQNVHFLKPWCWKRKSCAEIMHPPKAWCWTPWRQVGLHGGRLDSMEAGGGPEDAMARNKAKGGWKQHKSWVYWTRFGHDAVIVSQVKPCFDLVSSSNIDINLSSFLWEKCGSKFVHSVKEFKSIKRAVRPCSQLIPIATCLG
jgi:hypothetical protein